MFGPVRRIASTLLGERARDAHPPMRPEMLDRGGIHRIAVAYARTIVVLEAAQLAADWRTGKDEGAYWDFRLDR